MLEHRLRLFDAAISPTICYAAGTWTPNKEHEKMIQSTQRKMLRLIILTKRKYKTIEKQDIGTNEEIEEIDINEVCGTDDESGGGLSTTTHNDVDSDVSFEDDADEEIDTTSIEEEDWIEYTKRSTEEAIEKMESAKIRCWNKTHQKMKWKLAQRIATSPSDRWLRKAADWNPELSTRYRTNRAIGRPRKRWEDDMKISTTQLKATVKPTKHGSTLPKTEESGLEEAYKMTIKRTTGDEKKEKMIKADQRDNLMGDTKRKNERMTTKDAAAPQFRIACIHN